MINSQGDKGNTYKVTFTQRPEGSEGVISVDIWEKSI